MSAIRSCVLGVAGAAGACLPIFAFAHINSSSLYNHTREMFGHVLFYGLVVGSLVIVLKQSKKSGHMAFALISWSLSMVVGLLFIAMHFKG